MTTAQPLQDPEPTTTSFIPRRPQGTATDMDTDMDMDMDMDTVRLTYRLVLGGRVSVTR